MRLLLAAVWLFAASAASAAAPVILVVGDSISAAHGVALDNGWVARLQDRLAERGYPHRVVNASVGGDTTSGGLARLPDALARHRPSVVVIELGGNDGLRGQPPNAMTANLGRMVTRARAAGARVLLLGVRLPPNYGPAYTEAFAEAYRKVAREHDAALVPRVLAGVGERRALMQGDGIHPNAAGHARILDNVWPALRALIGEP
jgi:acyl-CoA thioesterase-1